MYPYAYPLHMKIVKHFSICLVWMYDPSWEGLKPQSMRNCMVCDQAVTQEICSIQKYSSTLERVME